MTQRNLRRAMDRACVLFSDLIEGRWEKVDGEFDATLRGHVLTDRFVPVWAKVVDAAGTFERIDAPSARLPGSSVVTPWWMSRWLSRPAGQSGK
jgi:hypothetical protein